MTLAFQNCKYCLTKSTHFLVLTTLLYFFYCYSIDLHLFIVCKCSIWRRTVQPLVYFDLSYILFATLFYGDLCSWTPKRSAGSKERSLCSRILPLSLSLARNIRVFFSSAQMPGTNLNRRYPNISLLSLAYVNKAATLNIEKSIEHRMSTACLLEVLICSDYYGNGWLQ